MWYYRRRQLREVKGGIKLQSRRGESARSWWGQRWNDILYGYIDEGRLSRGRNYARRGQVASIDVEKGVVRGVVQGSERQPYKLTIKVRRLTKKEWERVADSLMARPAIAAKLMAGQMPEELEDVFEDAGLSLFPDDVKSECDCYDWENPCKHIAAVYLILSEQFDRDPFLILRLRGMDQGELLDMMGVRLAPDIVRDAGVSVLAPNAPEREPLPVEMGAFWGREGSARLQTGRADVPEEHAALPRRLGSFPFWRSGEAFADALETIYGNASKAGTAALLGEADGG